MAHYIGEEKRFNENERRHREEVRKYTEMENSFLDVTTINEREDKKHRHI